MKTIKIGIWIVYALLIQGTKAFAGFGAEFNLADVNGNNGLTIHGEHADDRSGVSVNSAGDVNGDGISDIIIGAPNAGRSYVVFGSDHGFSDPFSHPLYLASLNGTNGFIINAAENNDGSGQSVASAGDFNKDGITDLLIGAPRALSSNAGAAYVIFGNREEDFANPFELSDVDADNGLVIHGHDFAEQLGFSVSSAGDINGDDIDDIIIGAHRGTSNGFVDNGTIYVVFGNEAGLSSPFNVSSIDGINGFKINGLQEHSARSGASVDKAGDVNGDGISDLLIGVPDATSNGMEDSGMAFIIFGTINGFPNPINLSSVDGVNGIQINAEHPRGLLGRSVSSLGDVNGDGTDDIILGAPTPATDSTGEGVAYVIFGSDDQLAHPFNVSTINGLNGFKITSNTLHSKLASSVSGAGDINGDGLTDIIIGEPESHPDGVFEAGRGHVIFGRNQRFSNPYNIDNVNGTTGYVINGINELDLSGVSINEAGDFNHDGYGDIVIGASGADPFAAPDAGSSYVIFGKEQPIFADGFD